MSTREVEDAVQKLIDIPDFDGVVVRSLGKQEIEGRMASILTVDTPDHVTPERKGVLLAGAAGRDAVRYVVAALPTGQLIEHLTMRPGFHGVVVQQLVNNENMYQWQTPQGMPDQEICRILRWFLNALEGRRPDN